MRQRSEEVIAYQSWRKANWWGRIAEQIECESGLRTVYCDEVDQERNSGISKLKTSESSSSN